MPLSFAQERLWFLQQLEPGSAAYNMPLGLELMRDALRIGSLAAALTELHRRHESLRTTFVSSIAGDGELCQRIAPPAATFLIRLPLVDLSALPEAARRSAAEGLARWHAGWEFDLARGPLFVGLLVRLQPPERHRLLLNLHHAISDGWSIQVLARELGELYAASVEGRRDRLPELPIQYADFAQWQRRWLEERQEEELAYWESRLGGERGEVASAELPTDRPRPAVQTFRGGRRHWVLGDELAARIKRFNRAESVTLFMTLLAATQALLARHGGEPEVAVGVPVAGRQWAETENLIGCFLNTLVLRTDTSGRPGFRELAARVRTVTLEAYSHQSVPFEAVLARLGLRRDLSRAPLFQVLFNLLNLPATELSLPGLELRALMPAEVPSKLDVTFYVAEAEARIGIDLVYNADLFDAAHMEDLLAQLGLFLDQALERPGEPVADLPLVTAAMRPVLPDPALALDGSWIGSVYELFAATAARAPERTAVADGFGARTYGGLLAASRRIAGWLGGARRAAGRSGRHPGGAGGAAGRGDPRRAGRRRRLPDAGCRLSGLAAARNAAPGGPAGVDLVRGRAGSRRGAVLAARGRLSGPGAPCGRCGRSRGACAVRRAGAGGPRRSGGRGLHRLHLGIDGRTERGFGTPRLAVALPADPLPAVRPRSGRPLLPAFGAGARSAPAGDLHRRSTWVGRSPCRTRWISASADGWRRGCAASR